MMRCWVISDSWWLRTFLVSLWSGVNEGGLILLVLFLFLLRLLVPGGRGGSSLCGLCGLESEPGLVLLFLCELLLCALQ